MIENIIRKRIGEKKFNKAQKLFDQKLLEGDLLRVLENYYENREDNRAVPLNKKLAVWVKGRKEVQKKEIQGFKKIFFSQGDNFLKQRF